MWGKLVPFLAVPLAVGGWWGIYQLTSRVNPDQPNVLLLFFILLSLTLTATLAPLTAYLNLRFAPEATARAPLRFIRHSLWAGLCLSSWVWLQMHRALNLGFAFIIALIFVTIEVFFTRARNEA